MSDAVAEVRARVIGGFLIPASGNWYEADSEYAVVPVSQVQALVIRRFQYDVDDPVRWRVVVRTSRWAFDVTGAFDSEVEATAELFRLMGEVGAALGGR